MKYLKFLSLEKLLKLEETLGYLSTYLPVPDEKHVIGESVTNIDVELTKLFKELGEINSRRFDIIKKIHIHFFCFHFIW